MRNNFAAVFVLHILMHLTSQSLPPPRGTNENSSKRNSLSELRSTSSPIYECLFLDPDLPICDEELWVLLRYQNSSLICFFSPSFRANIHRRVMEFEWLLKKKKNNESKKIHFLRSFFNFFYFSLPLLIIIWMLVQKWYTIFSNDIVKFIIMQRDRDNIRAISIYIQYVKKFCLNFV